MIGQDGCSGNFDQGAAVSDGWDGEGFEDEVARPVLKHEGFVGFWKGGRHLDKYEVERIELTLEFLVLNLS